MTLARFQNNSCHNKQLMYKFRVIMNEDKCIVRKGNSNKTTSLTKYSLLYFYS